MILFDLSADAKKLNESISACNLQQISFITWTSCAWIGYWLLFCRLLLALGTSPDTAMPAHADGHLCAAAAGMLAAAVFTEAVRAALLAVEALAVVGAYAWPFAIAAVAVVAVVLA